mmetsp:Transcript_18667/g.13530  ORF Transcript_18667/g.13530 Transcript_18667/m.13530 type:complete len:145 (+) Transcript_18667:1114-1548(+)
MSNAWNISDTIGLFLIIVAEAMHIYNQVTDRLEGAECGQGYTEEQRAAVELDYSIRVLYSIASFFVWMRAIYFFRMIRSTGYFVKMVFEVVADLKNFLLIYIAALVAFSHAYYIIFRNNEDEFGLSSPLLDSFWGSFKMVYMIP